MKTKKIPIQCTARKAGFLYFLNAITGALGFLIIPNQLFMLDDMALTAQNILDNEFLFRLGIFSIVACQIIFIFLALQLYKLFQNVDLQLSRMLLVLVTASVPVAFFLLFKQISAFSLLQNELGNGLSQAQLHALAFLDLKIYTDGIIYIGVFWGLWLIPFGMLTYRSGFMPKILGVLLIAGGISYLVDVSAFLLVPEFQTTTNVVVAIISSIAELSMVIWLMIKGVDVKKLQS